MKKNYEALEKLQTLLEKGILTQEEFDKEKHKLLNNTTPDNTTTILNKDFFGLEENTYNMMIHLSSLLGIVGIIFGIIAPIVLWSLFKDKYISTDNHGRVLFNWLLSSTLYALGVGLLWFIMGGFGAFMFAIPLIGLLIFVYAVMNLIQIIMGAYHASNGKMWPYPLSIPFIKMRK